MGVFDYKGAGDDVEHLELIFGIIIDTIYKIKSNSIGGGDLISK